jgi:hypothetical protein
MLNVLLTLKLMVNLCFQILGLSPEGRLVCCGWVSYGISKSKNTADILVKTNKDKKFGVSFLLYEAAGAGERYFCTRRAQTLFLFQDTVKGGCPSNDTTNVKKTAVPKISDFTPLGKKITLHPRRGWHHQFLETTWE